MYTKLDVDAAGALTTTSFDIATAFALIAAKQVRKQNQLFIRHISCVFCHTGGTNAYIDNALAGTTIPSSISTTGDMLACQGDLGVAWGTITGKT